jgi:hypothetical protein
VDRKNDLAENHDVTTRARGEDGEEGGEEGGEEDGEEGFPRTSMDIRSPVCRVRQMDGWINGWMETYSGTYSETYSTYRNETSSI